MITSFEVDNKLLNKMLEMNVNDYINCSAVEKLAMHTNGAFAEQYGTFDFNAWLERMYYEEINVSWIGAKENKVFYYESYKDVEKVIKTNINQLFRHNYSVEGIEFSKVKGKIYKDKKGRIIKTILQGDKK